MLSKIHRVYKKSDLEMLQQAQLFYQLFIDDKLIFIAANPLFNDPFANNFNDAIMYADNFPSDEDNITQAAILTEKLNNLLTSTYFRLQELYTYTELAWNSRAKTYSFGKNKYNEYRQSVIDMADLLVLGYNLANEPQNNIDLLAVGYTQEKIDYLNTMADDIKNMYELREEMYANYKIETESRIKALNEVWGFMQQINRMSKLIFKDKPAKLKQYLLY